MLFGNVFQYLIHYSLWEQVFSYQYPWSFLEQLKVVSSKMELLGKLKSSIYRKTFFTDNFHKIKHLPSQYNLFNTLYLFFIVSIKTLRNQACSNENISNFSNLFSYRIFLSDGILTLWLTFVLFLDL